MVAVVEDLVELILLVVMAALESLLLDTNSKINMYLLTFKNNI